MRALLGLRLEYLLNCCLRSITIVSFIALADLLSSCSGGGANSMSTKNLAVLATSVPAANVPGYGNSIAATTPSITTSSRGAVEVVANYKLPEYSTLSQSRSKADRRLQYISPSNTTISITVTPLGGAGVPFGATACTPGSCTITFTANPGPNTLAFTLKDVGGNVLSTFSTTQIVLPSVKNTLNFSANAVVDHVSLALASASVNAGTAVNDSLIVNAYDKDNNIISNTSNYVDANGNVLTLALSTSNTQAGGRGNVSIQGATRITAPSQAATFAHYDGNWLDHADIFVTSTQPIAGSLTGTTLTTIPTAIEYSTGAGSQPDALTAGPDGNMWIEEFGHNQIDRMTTNGVLFASYGVAYTANGILSGPDGRVWFGQNTPEVGAFTAGGGLTEYTNGFTPGSSSNGIIKLAVGADGNLWGTYNEHSSVERITPTGTVTEFTANITAGAQPWGITNGPDGNIWFVELGGNRIGRITTRGEVKEFSTGISASAGLYNITTGPDGNLWFTESNVGRIGRITPQGAITEFSSGITAGAAPYDIINGPDGNLWFTESGIDRIARITTAGIVTEFPASITGGSTPYGMAVGPEGNLWFSEYNGDHVAKFIF